MLVMQLPPTSPWAPHQVAGLLLWAAGWAANLHSDYILRNLRRSPSDKGEVQGRVMPGGGGGRQWIFVHNTKQHVSRSASMYLACGLWHCNVCTARHRRPNLTVVCAHITPAGYHIPRGGLFEFVSAANYTAEILEWSGYALAAWRLPAAAFAWFTFCNLAPRGLAHHQWYLQKFKEQYPRKRKAVIPFIW
jgi:hypothetical protein